MLFEFMARSGEESGDEVCPCCPVISACPRVLVGMDAWVRASLFLHLRLRLLCLVAATQDLSDVAPVVDGISRDIAELDAMLKSVSDELLGPALPGKV